MVHCSLLCGIILRHIGSVCSSGYALGADDTCSKCDGSSGYIGLGVVLSLIFLCGVLAIAKRRYWIRQFIEFRAYFEEKTKNYDLRSFRTKGKVLFSFFQIVSTLPTALNLVYPNPFSFAMEFFSLTNVNVITVLNLGCIFSSNFYNRLR